jgi:hypothetical protein
MAEAYPLERLFLKLRESGMPLNWRDYQDALTALRGGFGGTRREDLVRVLMLIWARTDAERRMLEQVIGRIEPPTSEEIARYTHPETKGQATGDDIGPRQRESGSSISDAAGASVTMHFDETGSRVPGIPRPVFSSVSTEAFVLTPQPPVTTRALITAWRRFQARVREGPRVEPDVDGSIAKQCREGRLTEPVLRPLRRNRARLIALIDVSPSMAAWSMMTGAWEESIAQGRLGSAAVYYFSNVPDAILYRHRRLREPVEVREALSRHGGSALLVFSDGGAARGAQSRRRAEQTRDFLKTTGRHWNPVVWLNPMPETRWRGSTADYLAREPRLHMLAMSESSLVRAVDLLRGAQAA